MINKGIIFDLDGTLWDSSKEVTESWNIALKRCNIDLRITVKDMHNLMGKTLEDISNIIFSNLPKERALEIMNECVKEEDSYISKHGGTLYPQLEETLKQLSLKYKLFIVSNCQERYIETFLEYHNLDKYFLDFENAGRTKRPKGENIKSIIDRNNLDKAVYIGDTQGDYDATKIAGIPFIHAKYGFGKINEETNFINEISELPIYISKLL
ncbi:MAG: HAD family hydrolase [Tissierellia bacterium]|nr:HAD family hydrolase [Tissierellia bacterium]